MCRIVCLVLCLVAGSLQHEITTFKVPDAVEVGGNAELACEHNASGAILVKWWWTQPGDDTPHQIYQRLDDAEGHVIVPHVKPPLNITLSALHNDNVMLWNLQPKHSGEYSCEVTQNVTEERRNANDLIVYSLGTGPLLNMTKFEDDHDVQVTCEALGVAPEPNITITIDSNTLNTSILHRVTDDDRFNLFANATVPEVDLEGKEVFCRISFKDYAIEVPAAMTGISVTYHSDAWLASTTTAPETTEAPTETPEQPLPGTGGRTDSSWVLLAALAIPAHILALL